MLAIKNVHENNHFLTSKFHSRCKNIFRYGHQRWAITFSRHEKTLGIYLVWKNPSDGMKVFVDFSINLLNRVHFSQNQIYTAKGAKFTTDAKGKEVSVSLR